MWFFLLPPFDVTLLLPLSFSLRNYISFSFPSHCFQGNFKPPIPTDRAQSALSDSDILIQQLDRRYKALSTFYNNL